MVALPAAGIKRISSLCPMGRVPGGIGALVWVYVISLIVAAFILYYYVLAE